MPPRISLLEEGRLDHLHDLGLEVVEAALLQQRDPRRHSI